MEMNLNNTNVGFQDISKCDFNLHWSFSNYLRWLVVCEQLNQLPLGANVLELGAGDSPLSHYMENNFGRGDLRFTKVDANPECDADIYVADITNTEELMSFGKFDCIVFCEVVEHIFHDARTVMGNLYNMLYDNGMMILTTPTPPFDKALEHLVWPDCHEYEFGYNEVYTLCNKYFEVENSVGWSLKTREYNDILRADETSQKIYTNLRGLLPESMLRAIISMMAPIQNSRQVLMVCKKRRAINV